MLATSIVLLLVALIPPHRTRLNVVFATFALFILVFALLFISQIIPIDIILLSTDLMLRSIACLLTIVLLAWFSFVVHFLDYDLAWIKVLRWGLLGFAIIAIGLIVFADIVTDTRANFQFSLTYMSIGLLFIAITYSAMAIFLVWQSPEKRATWLRVPSLLIVSAYVLTLVLPNLLINLLLLKIGALWIASALLRHQIFTPIDTLNQELTEKNETLQTSLTDLEHEKAQVERLNQELKDSNHYKSQFLTMMSHELRTPLNAIVGYSELLTSPIYGMLNKQQADRVERIHRNGRHLTQLINTILDVDKLESKQLSMEFEHFDVQIMLEGLLKQIQPSIDEKTLALVQDIEPELPSLRADKKRVAQILHNLLDNAVKFTHEGTISLIVKTLSVNQGVSDEIALPVVGWLVDGRWMLFQVADTGIGIADEDLSHIFTNFVQLDSSNEREFGGIGLGLSLVKQLVEKHQGMIWVQSEVAVGTSFYVALPMND